MSQHVEVYLWSSGSSELLDLQRIDFEETSTATTVQAVLDASKSLTDALADWEFQCNLAFTGTCTFSYDPDENRVTLASTLAFDVTWQGNAQAALGFTGSQTGSTSYLGGAAPTVATPLLGVEVEPAEDGADVEVVTARHGRHWAIGFTNSDRFRVGLWMTQANAQAFLDGHCARGRLRVYLLSSDTNAQEAENLDGVVDGWVYDVAVGEVHGESEEFIRLDLKLARGLT